MAAYNMFCENTLVLSDLESRALEVVLCKFKGLGFSAILDLTAICVLSGFDNRHCTEEVRNCSEF